MITAIESGNEIAMKNYLLKPHKRMEICKGNVWVITHGGLRDCWRFIKDKFFVCFHFKYSPTSLLESISQDQLDDRSTIARFIEESDVCLGILTKRGNASIKSMVKVYKMEAQYTESLEKVAEAAKEATHDSVLGELLGHKKFDVGEALRCPGAQISGINTMALLMRLELYVDEHRWLGDQVRKGIQKALNTFV